MIKTVAQDRAKTVADSAYYFYSKSDFKRSSAYLKEYIALRPDDKFGYVQQAHALADLADFNGSNEVLAELLKRYPGLREAYAERGVNFLNLNRFDSCIVNLGRGLGVSSKLDSMIYRDRAVAYSRSGNFASALEDFDAAAKFNPTDREFYYGRALAKISLGRHQSAILDLSECLRIDPKNYAAINVRAECYFITKQFDKAVSDCNTGLKWWKDDPFLLFRRATCYMNKKMYNEAVADLNKCSSSYGNVTELLFIRGTSHYYLAHDEAAIKDLTAAAKVDTDNAEIYLMLGACKNNLKDGSGCADYQRAFELGNVDAKRIIAADCLPAASKK